MIITSQGWARACSNGACVEAARDNNGRVLVRDSKQGDASPIITYTAQQWAERVIDPIRNDDELADIYATRPGDGGDRVAVWSYDGVDLTFTEDEWQAFNDAVQAGYFDFEFLPVLEVSG